MKFYVYEWYNINTKEVFYVGKGSGKRYKVKSKRNKKFTEYIKNNEVDSRIVKYFKNEEEAFSYEKELTDYYRELNQCECNIIDGGYGGWPKIWSEEAREYYSENNIMKRPEQRERMSMHNPMYNKEIREKVGKAHGIKVKINGVIYDSISEAARKYNKAISTITSWCEKGVNPLNEKCEFVGERRNINKKTHREKRAVIIDGNYYPSLTEGAKSVDFSRSTLSRLLKEGKNTYKGHKIEYANQQPSQ